MPEGRPDPSLSEKFLPSSSVMAVVEPSGVIPISCVTNVLPVSRSVKRIGSPKTLGAPTVGMGAVCSHVASGAVGKVSLKVMRKAVVLGKLPSPNPPKDITVPPLGVPLKTCSVFQLTPIDGSPQSSPNPGGDM